MYSQFMMHGQKNIKLHIFISTQWHVEPKDFTLLLPKSTVPVCTESLLLNMLCFSDINSEMSNRIM